MITIGELLDDAEYRKFFLTVPQLPRVHRLSPPWRLYVQKEAGGAWGKKDFPKYSEAVRFFNRIRSTGIHDATVNSRCVAFLPPERVVRVKGKFVVNSKGKRVQATALVVWKPKLPPGEDEHHQWCAHCRRPTVFKRYQRHHAFRGEMALMMDSLALRCCICGVRLEGMWLRQRR